MDTVNLKMEEEKHDIITNVENTVVISGLPGFPNHEIKIEENPSSYGNDVNRINTDNSQQQKGSADEVSTADSWDKDKIEDMDAGDSQKKEILNKMNNDDSLEQDTTDSVNTSFSNKEYLVDRVNKRDGQEKESRKLNTARDNLQNVAVSDGPLDNDCKNSVTVDVNGYKERVPDTDENARTYMSSMSVDGAGKVSSHQPLIMTLKPVRKRGRPRKIEVMVKLAGKRGDLKKTGDRSDTSEKRNETEDFVWETVEPEPQSASAVRRSCRKRKQKRISYIDLLEDHDDSPSSRDKCNNDKEVGHSDTLFVGDRHSPLSHSTPSGRKDEYKTKRKVVVRKMDQKSTETENKKSAGAKDKVISVNIKEDVKDDLLCEHCDMSFRYKKQLNNHKLVCGRVEASGVPIIPTKKISKTCTACPVCQKKFAKLNGVKRHLSLSHSHLVHISCALCSKKIGDIDENFQHFYEDHQIPRPGRKENLKPGTKQCPVCGEVLTQNRATKLHLVNAHSYLIHVTCTLCDRPVGTMQEYFQHFVRYHSHSSITRDKNKEVVTTNIERTMRNAFEMKSNEARHEATLSSEKSDLVCPHCNKCLETYKLLNLHMLSHKIDENTDIVTQKSIIQSYSMSKSNSEQNFSSSNKLNEETAPSDLTCKPKSLSDIPLPVWCLHPESLDFLSCVSSVLGPDLVASISCSINILTDMATQLMSELHWKDQDYMASNEDLVKKMNKVLQFSSSITDIGKCVLLVLEECYQFRGNPYMDNVNIVNEFDEEMIEDEDDVSDHGETGTEVRHDDLEEEPVGNNELNDLTVDSESKGSNNITATQKVTFEKGPSSLDHSLSEFIHAVESQKLAEIDVRKSDKGSVHQSKKKKILEGATENANNLDETPEVLINVNKPPRKKLKAKAAGSSSTSLKKTKLKKLKNKYICRKCGKHLAKKSSLIHHMLTHSEIRPFKCNKCPAGFKAEDRLRRHVLVHQKDERYKCDFCDFACRTTSLMQKHSFEEHPASPFFHCDQCKHQCKTSYDLATHKKIHEPRKCKMCDFEARHLSELKAHERKNHANKSCTVCSYRCISNYQLKRHMNTHVKPELEKIYCCELCGAMFDTKRKMEYHVLRHTNKTPLSCNQCDYKCSSRQSYDAHMLKHSGLKPFKCQLCDASFHRASYLKQHMRMHSDEKEFCCKYCGKGFKYKYNCVEHEMIHTGEKKFKCKYCDFACRRRKLLDQHMEEHKGRGSDVEGQSGVEDISCLLKPDNLVPIL